MGNYKKGGVDPMEYEISLFLEEALTNITRSAYAYRKQNLWEDVNKITKLPWSPIIFTHKKRSKETFKSCSLLVFDIDNDPGSAQLGLRPAQDKFGKYTHIIGTTRSHLMDKGKKGVAERFRLVLFFDRPITTLHEYEAAWKYFKIELGLDGIVDESGKDGARFFYPCKEIYSLNKDGLILNTTTSLDYAEFLSKALTIATSNNTAASASPSSHTARGQLNKKTLSFLSQQPSSETWHHRFIAAAIDLKTQGYSMREAAEQLARASSEGALDMTHDWPQLEDVYTNNRGAAGEFRPFSYPEVSVKEKKDGTVEVLPVKGSMQNCKALILEQLHYKPRFNSRANCIEKAPGEQLTDSDLNLMYVTSILHKLGLSKEMILAQLDVIAQENKIDPLIDTLNKVIWDGRSRIAELAETLTFSPDASENTREIATKYLRSWLIGIVTRIYHPGSENNMLVFVGKQGAGKTRWFKRLAEPYPQGFIESHINPDDKDSHLNLLKYFIWSVSELDTVTYSKDVGALKDFITKSEVRARQAYGRFDTIGSAITSFCASVNSMDFLHDTTGNRRYLVIPVDAADFTHNVDIMQVYAEARAAMQAGERAWFNANEIEVINKYNDQFMYKSDILELFEERLIIDTEAKPLSLREILESMGSPKISRAEERSLRDWLTKRKCTVRNHSGVKKYNVKILSANSTKNGAVVVSNLLKPTQGPLT